MKSNAKMKIFVLVIGLLMGTIPASTLAGINETPGEDGGPHKFSAFTPVRDEFGIRDLSAFLKYVVTSQHYAMGAIYSDFNVVGEPLLKSNIEDFCTFLSSRNADVMLVASHGTKNSTTLVEKYPNTRAGREACQTSYDLWTSRLGPGTLRKVDGADGVGIEVTQTFYNLYLDTPQALCWWATCHSASIYIPIGPNGKVRDYIYYADSVISTSCSKHEEYVLERMDGRKGVPKRPLEEAMKGVNSIDPTIVLMHSGAGNTTLSPAVVLNEPIGIVCTTTDGFVLFDTSLDTDIPPQMVLQVFGDGYGSDWSWLMDDMVLFTVHPTSPDAIIDYTAFEHMAISKQNHARLDGNTNPAINGHGPNQDDYIWVTICAGIPSYPVKTPDPIGFVRISLSPGWAPRFVKNSSG